MARLITRRPVRALYRAPSARSAALHGHGCDVVPGDLENDRALAALVGADQAYHCAATMGRTDGGLSHRVNVEGTERVARAAAAAGVRRFVYVSSTSVYAASRRDDNTYPETFEPEHIERLNHYSRTKDQGEQVVRRLAEREGLRFTIIRPTNIYGLRSRPWFRQWEHLLRRLPVAFGEVPIDVVYVKDVVMAMEWAAVSEAAENEVFNIGHEMVKMNRFVGAVGIVIGRATTTLPPRIDRGVCRRGDRPRVHHVHAHQDVAVACAPGRVPARQGPRRVRLLPSGPAAGRHGRNEAALPRGLIFWRV